MAPLFVYILHKNGVADDSAAEILGAARKIDPAQAPTAVVTGWGPAFDSVCEGLRNSFVAVWKIADPGLAYPDAELVRKALNSVLPRKAILLVPHSHFGDRKSVV